MKADEIYGVAWSFVKLHASLYALPSTRYGLHSARNLQRVTSFVLSDGIRAEILSYTGIRSHELHNTQAYREDTYARIEMALEWRHHKV